jgi:hypothetical protein
VPHYTFAAVAALALAATLAVAGVALVSGRSGQPWLDRMILVQSALVALAMLTGLPGPLAGRPPPDSLHYLYAVVALIAIPIARYVGRRTDRAAAGWVAGACGVEAVVLLRLWMTG